MCMCGLKRVLAADERDVHARTHVSLLIMMN